MPCGDITENLVLSLDNEYRVLHYALHKKTCGAKVGQQSLLFDWVKGKSLSAFAKMEMDDFLVDYGDDFEADFDRFIALKHFDALRGAARALCGDDGCSKKDAVVFDFLEITDKGVDVRAYIGVDVDPSGNTGCGNGCSTGGGGCKKK